MKPDKATSAQWFHPWNMQSRNHRTQRQHTAIPASAKTNINTYLPLTVNKEEQNSPVPKELEANTCKAHKKGISWGQC